MPDALGNVTTYTYYGPTDSAKYRLHTIERGGMVLYSYTYDSKGRVQIATNPTGLILTYTHNDLDQITSITYPDGKQKIYTYSSCCPKLIDSYTDRSGRTTYYTYDAMKHLIQLKNPDGTLIKHDYDADGNEIRLTDTNGNVTRFFYDSSDRLIKKLYANSKEEDYSYDADDLLVNKKNARGAAASYLYDPNNNLTGITYSDGTTPNVSYTYDAYNRITSRTDGIGTWNYTYDANSKLLTVQTPWDSSPTLAYSYDDEGRRTSISPEGGDAIGYGYDAIGRLSTITAGGRAFASSYPTGSPSPIPVSLTRPNGSATNYQYDPLQRLTEISNLNSVPQVINAIDFTYNSPSNMDMRDTETITNGQPMNLSSNVITYNYNNVNQLLNSSNPARTYTYDADGNMIAWFTPDGYEATGTYDAENMLTSASNAIIAKYDSDGKIIWQYTIGSPFSLGSGRITAKADGSIIISAINHGDFDGNVFSNSSSYYDYFISKLINFNPSSTISSPIDGATLNGTTIISGTATDRSGTGIEKVQISINGSDWLDASGTSNWSYTWAPTSNGQFNIKSRAIDNQGNIEFPGTGITLTVIIPPISSIASPVNGTVIYYICGDTCAITGAATDPLGLGISKVEISTDDGTTWKGPSDGIQDTSGSGTWATWSYAWMPPAVGSYIIKSRATDSLGTTEIPSAGNSIIISKAVGTGSSIFGLPAGLLSLDTQHHYDDNELVYDFNINYDIPTVPSGSWTTSAIDLGQIQSVIITALATTTPNLNISYEISYKSNSTDPWSTWQPLTQSPKTLRFFQIKADVTSSNTSLPGQISNFTVTCYPSN
jgi:YD repeat-containing protein